MFNKMKNLLYIFVLLFALNVSGQNIYYVTTSGSNSNSGADEANAWSLSHAFNTAQSGDIVYIKAGLYSDYNITQNNNGTLSNPIKFMGYKTTINDINSDLQEDYTLGNKTIKVLSAFAYGDIVDSSEMPLLQETSDSSMAINIQGNYVEVYNIQIQNYGSGIWNYGDNNVFKNLICVDQGNQNNATYTGNAIRDYGDYCNWKNIYIENTGAQSFTVSGNNGSYDAISIVCDNTGNPTDYYFLWQNNTEPSVNNETTNLYLKRVGNLAHDGHGASIKSEGISTNNNLTDFIIDNTKIEITGPNSHNNTFKDGVVFTNSSGDGFLNFRLSNGAHDNLIQNVHSKGAGIAFNTTYTNFDDTTNGADNNVFDRCIFDGNGSNYPIIRFHYSDASGGFSQSNDNNKFYNCTFYDAVRLFENSRANSGTELVNCIVDNFSIYTYHSGGSSGYTLDISYNNCNFSNLGFTTPTGTNISTVNPLFTDVTNDDFSLQSASVLNDAGIATPYLSSGNDIGAVQDGTSTPPVDTTSPIITSILDNATTNSITIDWHLDEGSTGRIEWGTDANFGNLSTLETRFLTHHVQTITGLNSGTQYYYKVLGEDAAGNILNGATRTITTASNALGIKQKLKRIMLIRGF